MSLSVAEQIFLNSLYEKYGDIKVEYEFYKRILNSGFIENLTDEDYEIWESKSFEFIEEIIANDDLYWQIEEIISMKAMGYLDNLKH